MVNTQTNFGGGPKFWLVSGPLRPDHMTARAVSRREKCHSNGDCVARWHTGWRLIRHNRKNVSSEGYGFESLFFLSKFSTYV